MAANRTLARCKTNQVHEKKKRDRFIAQHEPCTSGNNKNNNNRN